MPSKDETHFGKFRSFLWPIERSEYKKFIPMLLMFFLITFNYNLLRACKDTMIITAPSSGAEAIPFIKVWFMLPMAVFITYIFTRLSNKFSSEKVFYSMIGIFLGFFFLFTFVLYPYKDVLHPNQFADKLETILPIGLKGFIALLRNWTYTAFYVMSELWGTTILTVLFWGFANEITSVKEAKRYYALFGVGANISGIFSGKVAMLLSSNIYMPSFIYGNSAWEQSVLFLNTTILLTGLLIMAIYRWLNKNYLRKNPTFSFENKEKIKMSIRKNFKYLAKSKYLICIAVIVITYNIALNLVEVVWKNQVKQMYPTPGEYNIFMGQVMIFMGIIATITSLLTSGILLRKFSWTFNALIPPIIMLSTGICFFTFLLFNDSTTLALAAFFGSTPLILSILFGTLQNCMSRASKYTLFDATKELSFIPLSSECKLKGKAAIDGVGSRFGKSGGSIIHQGLLVYLSTVAACTPYIAGIFLFVVGFWIIAAVSLGRKFNSLTAHHETLDIKDTESASSKDETKITVPQNIVSK